MRTYLRLIGNEPVQWNSRGHFFSAAAEAMRRILIERARKKSARKHGGGLQHIDLDQVDIALDTDDDRHDDRRALRLIPAFNPPVPSRVGPGLLVGDRFTFGGTLAHPNRPDIQIGTFAVHFVVTATTPEGAAERLGNGGMILPDGKISFQILLRRPVMHDRHGNINRYSAITGGTDAYRNADSVHIECMLDGVRRIFKTKRKGGAAIDHKLHFVVEPLVQRHQDTFGVSHGRSRLAAGRGAAIPRPNPDRAV